MDILSDKKVKTRKDHQCLCCFRVIPKGSMMRVQVNNFDGLQSFRMCETCEVLCYKHPGCFFDDGDCVFPEGCVEEAMSEFKVETPGELLKIFQKTFLNIYIMEQHLRLLRRLKSQGLM